MAAAPDAGVMPPPGGNSAACLADLAAGFDEVSKAVEEQFAKLIAELEHQAGELAAANPAPKLKQQLKNIRRQILKLEADREAVRLELRTAGERR